MQDAIALWSAIYQNQAPWLVPKKNETIRSLYIGASIASELARLTCLEFKSEIKPKEEAKTESLAQSEEAREKPSSGPHLDPTFGNVLNEDYQRFLDKLRSYVEQALALGSCLLKPYTDEEGNIHINMIPATHVYPITFAPDGTLT
jgi:hypothetical protein